MKTPLQLIIFGFLVSAIMGNPVDRFSRQIVFPENNNNNNNQDPTLVRGPFTGFGQFQPGQNFNGNGQGGLTIAGNGGRQIFIPGQRPPPIGGQGNGLTIGNPNSGGLVSGGFVSGFGQLPPSSTTQATPTARTTPSQAYLRCLSNCPTTMEYNPVCGSDSQNYHNEQRLECAQICGNNVSLIRRGTCLPL